MIYVLKLHNSGDEVPSFSIRDEPGNFSKCVLVQYNCSVTETIPSVACLGGA